MTDSSDPSDPSDPSEPIRLYHYKPRVCVRCPECGVEHRGKCHFLRRSPRAKYKASVEQVRAYINAAKQRRLQAHVRRLIKELSNAVEEGRRAARRANRWTPEAKKPGRPAGRRNTRLTTKDKES